MPFTGVYPVTDPIFAGPKKFATVPRYELWLPGLLPEAQEATSLLLNVSQTRAEEDIWVWISRDYLLNALRQDILACDKERIGLQLTDTYQMPKRTRGGALSRLDYAWSVHLTPSRQNEDPQTAPPAVSRSGRTILHPRPPRTGARRPCEASPAHHQWRRCRILRSNRTPRRHARAVGNEPIHPPSIQ